MKPLTPTQAAAHKEAEAEAIKKRNAEKVKTRRRIAEIKEAIALKRDAA